MKMKDLKKKIKTKIYKIGFDIVTFSRPYVDSETKKRYLEFLHKNYHGDMRWLERHYEKKIDPKKVWEEVETIAIVGHNYTPKDNPLKLNCNKDLANISVYAQNEDYHDIISEKLRNFKSWLFNNFCIESKIFVDSSPILEKYFAQKTKIGWQGKHTNIVSKTYGSWLFLSEIFLPIKIISNEESIDNCGTCNQCQDICPTNALSKSYKIDARKCISYLTIEHKGPIPISLRKKIGNKVYGCDDCLSICPWNKFSPESNEKKYKSKGINKNLSYYLDFDEQKFNEFFVNSPIKRIGWNRFLRNIIIATGNSKNRNLIKYLKKHLENQCSIIRGTCIWALFQLINNKEKKEIKYKILKYEKNSYVLYELNMTS